MKKYVADRDAKFPLTRTFLSGNDMLVEKKLKAEKREAEAEEKAAQVSDTSKIVKIVKKVRVVQPGAGAETVLEIEKKKLDDKEKKENKGKKIQV